MDSLASPPPIGSREQFQTAVQWGVQAALARQARRLFFVDTDFAHWPLGQPELLASLQAWLKLPQRRLLLLAAHYDEMPRQHPRFVAWRRDWAHTIDAYIAPAECLPLPCGLVDDGPVCVQRFAGPTWRGRAEADAREARRWREDIDAILQRSEPGFPVQTLGL